jgi:hypothetical protein
LRERRGPGPSGDARGLPRWAAQPPLEEIIAVWLSAAPDVRLHKDDAEFQRWVETLAEDDRDMRRLDTRAKIPEGSS